MTEQPRQVKVSDVLVAQALGMKAAHLVKETAVLAASLGTEVTVQQVLAAVLAVMWKTYEKPLTLEEFAGVYVYVANLHAQQAKTANDGGAEATPDAAGLHDRWSTKIDGAAFGFNIPSSLDEFPPEAIGG